MHDYAAGKAEWLASGLPFDGDAASRPRVGTFARPARSVRRSDARPEAVSDLDDDEPAILVDESGVVLAITVDGEERAPRTFRPDASLESLRDHFENSGASTAIVTSGRGRLLGVVRRRDVESAGCSAKEGEG